MECRGRWFFWLGEGRGRDDKDVMAMLRILLEL